MCIFSSVWGWHVKLTLMDICLINFSLFYTQVFLSKYNNKTSSEKDSPWNRITENKWITFQSCGWRKEKISKDSKIPSPSKNRKQSEVKGMVTSPGQGSCMGRTIWQEMSLPVQGRRNSWLQVGETLRW